MSTTAGSRLGDATTLVLINSPHMHVSEVEACCRIVPAGAIKRHHLTAAAYLRMLHAQQGGCAICQKPTYRNDEIIPLFIDHDQLCCPTERRTCGRCVRGLLCNNCNFTLGTIEVLGSVREMSRRPAAVMYLRSTGCDPALPSRRAAFAAIRERIRQERIAAGWRLRLGPPRPPGLNADEIHELVSRGS